MTNDFTGNGRDGGSRLHTNRVVAIGLLIGFGVLALYLLVSPRTYILQRDGFYLGFFPLFGLAFMAVFAIMMLFDEFRDEVNEEMTALSWRTFAYVVLVLLAGYVFFLLQVEIGFLIMAPIYLCILMYLLGLRPLKTAVIAAVLMAATIYAIFRIIGIKLASGILPF